LHHDNAPSHTSFLTREIFLPKTTWLSSFIHSTFLFSRLKIKLKGHYFETTEVMEAESQTVLNNLAEHYFQDPLWGEWRCFSNRHWHSVLLAFLDGAV
jgi:hypothetical protein